MLVLFVYNGDSSLRAAAADLLVKLVNPSAYPCSLCGLTSGIFGLRKEWKRFLRTLELPHAFYHRDQFHAAFPELKHVALPAVFLRSSSAAAPQPCIEAHEIDAAGDLASLQRLIAARLKAAGGG